jgi:hypothetical protein
MAVNPCFIENATNADIDRGIEQRGGAAFASKLWRYTKANYSEQGVGFKEALPKLAADFKIPQRVVSRILDTNKQVRVVTEDLAKLQRQNRQFLADNRRYIANNSRSDAVKILSMINDGVRGTLLGGHGPVIGAIHPIDQLFTPGRMTDFFRAYGRAIKSAAPGTLDEIMSRYEGMDRWQKWQDVGMPLARNDRIESTRVFGWGGRAMETALKPLMYEYAEALRERSSPELKDNPDMMRDNASQAAHASGALLKGELGHGFLTKVFQLVQLASGLNTSRWMKTVIDPARTINTYTQAAIAKASQMLPERFQRPGPSAVERQGASNRTWQAGKWLGTMAGMLTVNDQFNRYMGLPARVNFTDPKRPDYLAFRVYIPGLGDYYIKTRGSMEVLQFLARMMQGAKPYAHGKYGERTPEEIAGRYFEYKATPSLSLYKEFATGKDVFGRPVPWSKDPGTRFAPQYYTEEWIGQHIPIFLGHGVQAFYEGMRDSGINPRDIHAIMRGVQQHPEILGRAAFESAAEFFGLNPMRERGRPYQVPQMQQRFEQKYLPGARKS